MRKTSLIGCLALAALTVGCSNAPAPTPDTRTADVQAVKDVEAAGLKTWLQRTLTSGPATLQRMPAAYTPGPGY